MRREPNAKMSSVIQAIPLCLMLSLATGCDIGADALAQYVRTYQYEPFRIPSGGMNPTLVVGDHIYVDKNEFDTREPVRGEIVVFRVARLNGGVGPVDRNPDAPQEIFIKRVVGLPGDEISWNSDGVSLNGAFIPELPVDEAFETADGNRVSIRSTQLGNVSFKIAKDSEPALPTSGSLFVEPNRFFVMGDFRTNSIDSRYFGTIRKSELVGPVVLRYYSGRTTGGGLVLERLGID